MKSPLLLFILLVINVPAQNFIREFPAQEFISQINSSKFPGSDAVILIKEQSLKVENSEITYRGYDFQGLSRYTSFVMLVKILNQAGISRYGSYEYIYPEFYGDEISAEFKIQGRVLKESGDIEIIPEDDVHRIVSLTDKNDNPRERKVIMKVANLQVGDVLQIEYTLQQPFSNATSGLFYYHDRDPVLFSNVYITLPSKSEMEVYSFPADKVSQPEIKQLSTSFGSGSTYFWSVRNCNAVPAEPYSRRFEEISYLTGFIVKKLYGRDYSNWNNIISNYYSDHVNKHKLPESFYKELQLPLKMDGAGFSMIDSLYYTLRKNFRITRDNSIYLHQDIDEVIEDREGDASDLSFIMLKVLEQWKQNAQLVLIRDRRSGMMETSFPTLLWFDRVGVLVTAGGIERVYDFDRSLHNKYENPWYFNDADLYVITQMGGSHKKMKAASGIEQNQIFETHRFTLTEYALLNDSLEILYKGYFAGDIRNKFYYTESDELKKTLNYNFQPSYYTRLDGFNLNDIYENNDISISLSGASVCTAEKVDSFLVVKPREVIFSKFKETLFSSMRKNDIMFDTPFRYTVNFIFTIPEGYEIKSLPPPASLATPFSAEFKMLTENDGDKVKVTGILQFTKTFVPIAQYRNLIQLVENSITNMSREIVFKSNSGE